MKQRDSGLWVAPAFNILWMRARERTVTLPNGERAKVTIDDSGTVKHVEHGDILDAVVRPATIRRKVVVDKPKLAQGGFGRPGLIRAIVRSLNGE